MTQIIRRAILAFAMMAGLVPAFAQSPPPVPALPDTERRTSYSITSSTCACAVNFALYGDGTDYQNWLEVSLNGVLVNYNDPTFGWTITSPTGQLGRIPLPITDAVLTFNSAQTGTVQIVGARRPRRVSQFAENRGVAARDLNQALTDVVAQNRETWDKINDVTGRAVVAPPGETMAVLPPASQRANMGVCFNSTGSMVPCAGPSTGTFTAGSGITFTGSNPTTIATNLPSVLNAGSGIQFSGTNPLTITSNQTYAQIYQAKLLSTYGLGLTSFACDGVTDDTPAWNALMNAVDAGTIVGGSKITFPYATCMFNSRPRQMASYLSLLGSSQQNTTFIRNYQPGLAKTVTNVANNGSGGCRVTYTPSGNLGVSTVFISGVTGGVPANGGWAISQITTTTIDLTGCSFSSSYTSGGIVLTAAAEPFIELGPQSSSDCIGFQPPSGQRCGTSQEIKDISILSQNNTYGGIGLDMGSFNFGGGYGYTYNSKIEHVFVTVAGNSYWYVAHQNNGCNSPGAGGVFVGNRDNTVSNSSFYSGPGSFATVWIQCSVASRYINNNVLNTGINPLQADLYISGVSGNPNYSLLFTGATTNSVTFGAYATISELTAATVNNVAFDPSTAVDNTVTAGYCSGTVSMVGTNNVVICNSNIFASSTYVIRSGASGGVQLTNGATSWAAVSDETLKTNIKPLSVLDRLNSDVAYSFDWKGNNHHEGVGVIAQRMEEMFPGVVTRLRDKDGEKFGVYKDQVGILALQGVKELLSRVETLEKPKGRLNSRDHLTSRPHHQNRHREERHEQRGHP